MRHILFSILASAAAMGMYAQSMPAETVPPIPPAGLPDSIKDAPAPTVPGTTATVGSVPLALTLDQCIEIALTDNPTIKVSDMEVTRYDYSRKETLAQLFPSISFNGSYNRTLAKQTMYMSFGGMGGLGGGSSAGGDDDDPEGESAAPASSGNNGIKVGLDNSYSVGFSMGMPLIAPQLWKSLKLSDSQILEKIESARASRISLVNQVKNAYYSLLLARDSYNVLLESYEMAKFTAAIYEKQFSVGTASEYDVLRTQVAVQNIEPDLLQAEIAIKQAKLQLLILMGLEPTLDIEAADALQNYEGTMYETALSIDRNIDNNSDLRMLDIQTRELNDALTINKMAWYPTLSLSASYNWTTMNNGAPFKGLKWSPYSMIGLTLNVPLFEGGRRYYAIKKSELQVEEMAWQREHLVRAINVQVDVAIDNIHKNIMQIASSSRTVGQAEKAHDIMQRSFEIGASSYLNLRDSEVALTQSRLAYYQSIYNYLIACSNLDLLLGRTDVSAFMPAY